jgi:phosphohistidine phosphatase
MSVLEKGTLRTLYLLRHAKSSWDDSALPDHERPLAPRGRRDAERLARHMLRIGLAPELVLCSTAVRTQQTLKLTRAAFETATVLVEENLYLASAVELLERLRLVPDPVTSVLVVGHNPSLQQLAIDLASGGDELGRLEVKFPTGALATLALTTTWSRLAAAAGTLAAFVVPKQLH